MTTNELIIFKKDTDAPGANRGFVYQYLKTLLLWLNNYKNKKTVTIYCEVDDDIKEINLIEQSLRFTQLKCYSSAMHINSDEVKKSLYNYFLLHLIYEGFEGEYIFETNTHISNRDTVIENWMAHQGTLHLNEDIQNVCITKTKEILREIFAIEKQSMEQAVEKKINFRKRKIEIATVEGEGILLEIEQLDKELEVLQNLSENFERKIDSKVIISDFTNRISWVFEDIDAAQSIEVLKEQVNEVLREIVEDEKRVCIYFSRLLSEINFKAVKEKRELRFIDNHLLEKIFKETDEVIRSGIDAEVIQKFEDIGITMEKGFSTVNQNIADSESRLTQKLDYWGGKIENRLQSTPGDTEYQFYEMPIIEPEDVEEFIKQEKNGHQSKLEAKFHKIEGIDEETRNNLLQTATELRCRYLLYLQSIKFQNFHREYNEIRILEKKIEGICNDAVIELQLDIEKTSAKFYISFKKEIKLALEEFNMQMKIKKFIVDTEVVYGQMFHMAAKCFLRWHRER